MENFNIISKTHGSSEWNEVTKDEIPRVIENLTKLWPESLIIYNFITESMKLGVKSKRTTVKLFCNSQNGLLIASSKGVFRRVVIFSSNKNYSGLETILEGDEFIDWNDGSVLFCALPLNLSEYLKNLCPSVAKRVAFCDEICDSYWMPPGVAKELNVECPEEMYFSPLEDCHTEIVNSTWHYANSNTYEMIRDLIRYMDTVGLFTKKDSKLVSWVLNAVYGIGLLYTVKEYRNKGYGTLVVKRLANILGKTDRTPFLVTVQSNSVTKSMFQKCGFISMEPSLFMEIQKM